MKIRFTDKRLLVVGGVMLILVVALVAGIVLSQFVARPNTEQPTKSGLPQSIEEIQDLRTDGKTEEANKKADELLNQASTSDDIKYMLYVQKGQASAGTEDYKTALDFYIQAASLIPTQTVYTMIGAANFALGNKTDAKAAYEKAITLIDQNSPLAKSDEEDLRQRIEIIDGKVPE